MKTLVNILPALAEQFDSPDMRAAFVKAVWPGIVGEHLRGRSRAVELHDGRLLVKVLAEEWKKELEHHAAPILFRLNKLAGRKVVTRIDFEVSPGSFHQVRSLRADDEAVHLDEDLVQAAGAIADAELRSRFLAAASASIKQN